MKHIFIILALVSGSAYAGCYGNQNYMSCDDGNSYNRSGNTLHGYNPNTGSSWSQTQQGNTTYYNDSHGNFRTCTQYGNTRQCF